MGGSPMATWAVVNLRGPWMWETSSQDYTGVCVCVCVSCMHICPFMGFPGGSGGKESACNARDPSSIPGSGRSPGEGNGNPLQYSCLENSLDRGAWQTTVHGVTESEEEPGGLQSMGSQSRTQLSD